jgi:hypothetical protein
VIGPQRGVPVDREAVVDQRGRPLGEVRHEVEAVAEELAPLVELVGIPRARGDHRLQDRTSGAEPA